MKLRLTLISTVAILAVVSYGLTNNPAHLTKAARASHVNYVDRSVAQHIDRSEAQHVDRRVAQHIDHNYWNETNNANLNYSVDDYNPTDFDRLNRPNSDNSARANPDPAETNSVNQFR